MKGFLSLTCRLIELLPIQVKNTLNQLYFYTLSSCRGCQRCITYHSAGDVWHIAEVDLWQRVEWLKSCVSRYKSFLSSQSFQFVHVFVSLLLRRDLNIYWLKTCTCVVVWPACCNAAGFICLLGFFSLTSICASHLIQICESGLQEYKLWFNFNLVALKLHGKGGSPVSGLKKEDVDYWVAPMWERLKGGLLYILLTSLKRFSWIQLASTQRGCQDDK